MRVVVKAQPGATRALQRGAAQDPTSESLQQIADELGIVLEPQHPGVDDPELSSFFSVEVPDAAAAERVIASLQEKEAIEGAYLKPPDEPA
jgi:hypothetical protein